MKDFINKISLKSKTIFLGMTLTVILISTGIVITLSMNTLEGLTRFEAKMYQMEIAPEQSSTMNEIATHVDEVSSNSSSIAANMNETYQEFVGINQQTQEVQDNISESGNQLESIKDVIKNLDQMTTHLKESLKKFTL